MRIIAGNYRGRILKSPSDLKTRPTSDRLRETLFNILSNRIDETTKFLDLCAGTGAVGIEALSRGAAFVTFIDKARKMCGIIEENLDNLAVPEEQTVIINNSAEEFLKRTANETWDIVYYDPPYQTDYAEVLLKFAEAEPSLLAAEGIFIAEHHTKKLLPDALGDLRRWRLLKQGDSSLSFYERD